MKPLVLIPALAMAVSLAACASSDPNYAYAPKTPLNGAEQQVLVGAAAGERLPDGTYAGSPVTHDETY